MVYHEKQYKQFCTVHAINAFFGFKKVTCDEMLKFARNYTRSKNTKLKKTLFDNNAGFFSIDIIQAWARSQGFKFIYLGTLTKDIINTYNSLVLIKNGHSTALVKTSKYIYHIDSYAPKPMIVTNSTVVSQQFSAYTFIVLGLTNGSTRKSPLLVNLT
jgi:hypothetical protein